MNAIGNNENFAWNDLFDSIDELFWYVDSDLKLVVFNDAFRQMFKAAFGKEIKIGDKLITHVPEALADEWNDICDVAIMGEKISYEFTIEIDNRERVYRVLLNPVKSNGKVKGITSIGIDVTKEKRTEQALQKSEQSFRDLLQFSPMALFLGNKDGRLLDINKAAEELTGYTRDELLQMSMEDLFPAEVLEKKPLRFDLVVQGEVVKAEREILRKDGSSVPVEMVSKKNPDDTLQCFMTDISRRVKALQLLRESEENYRLIADMSPNPIIVHRMGVIIYANSAALKIINGKELSDLVGQPISKFVHPDSEKVVRQRVEYMKKTGKGVPPEIEKLHRLDGSLIDAEVTATPIKFNNEFAIMVIVRDVTEIRATMRKLTEAEERFRTLAENTSTAIVVYSNETFVYVNNATIELTGYSEEELLKMKFWDVVHPDHRELVKKRGMKRQLGDEVPQRYEFKLQRKDGSEVWIDFTAGKITWNGQPAAIGSAVDISERKFAEEKLQASERKLRSIFNAIPDLFFIIDYNGRYIEIAPSQEHLLYLPKEQLLGKRLHEVFDKGLADRFLDLVRRTIETKNKNKLDYYLKIDGKKLWFQATTVPYEHDKVVYIASEITERKLMENKIIESEQQFRSVWENSLDPMRLIDKDGLVVDVNNAFCKLFSCEKEKFIGKPFDIIYNDGRTDRVEIFKRKFREHSVPQKIEEEVELHNGKKIWLEFTNSELDFGDDSKLLLSIMRDNTERKKILDDLVKAKEEAESMNRLKSQFFVYMSHELRTPFMGIMGYAQLLRDSVDDDLKEFANGIMRASQRLLRTLSDILDVTKIEFDQNEVMLSDINLNITLEQIYKDFFHAAEAKNLQFTKKIDFEDLIIRTDERIVFGILNNLINNAIKYTDEGSIELIAFEEKGNVVFKVKDTGIGIPKDKQDIIWEEFRQVSEGSTRAYQGSGLGLTIVKKYVELLNGEISLESEVGKGSTFTVVIPLDEDKRDR